MRLIDADALKEKICNNVYPIVDFFNSRDYGMFWTGGIEKAIDEAPTIEDAEPIKHGHYIGESDGYADGYPVYDIWSCSECGCYFEDWDDKPTYKYCPNCGARMENDD